MQKLHKILTEGTEFIHNNNTYICLSSKIIGLGVHKLVIYTTKKTVVLFTQKEIDDLIVIKTKNDYFVNIDKFNGIIPKTLTITELLDSYSRVLRYVSLPNCVELRTLSEFENLPLKRAWTQEEDKMLYIGIPVGKLALIINRGKHHVANRKRQLGSKI